MAIMRWVVKIIVAAAFGGLFVAVLTPGFAAFLDTGDGAQNLETGRAMLVAFGLAAVLIVFAPTIRRAFGRGFVLCGMAFVFLPLAALMLGGRVSMDVIEAASVTGLSDEEQTAAAVGSGLAAGVTTLAAGAVGFVMGTIFLVAGLVLGFGGRREVIVIDRERAVPSHRQEPPLRR